MIPSFKAFGLVSSEKFQLKVYNIARVKNGKSGPTKQKRKQIILGRPGATEVFGFLN